MNSDLDRSAAERFKEDLSSSLSTVSHGHNVEICLGKDQMKAITDGGSHLLGGERFLEFVRGDQNSHQLK